MTVFFGSVRRQLGGGGARVVGINRPMTAARPLVSNSVGGTWVSPGPSTISPRISRRFGSCSTSRSESKRKRCGSSSRSHTRRACVPASHGTLLQYCAGSAIRPPASTRTNSGANEASTTVYHKSVRLFYLFSICLLTSTIDYHILYYREWMSSNFGQNLVGELLPPPGRRECCVTQFWDRRTNPCAAGEGVRFGATSPPMGGKFK
jgi:hypothetical protein